jgi:DHA1 family inner membrane transport protein
MKYGSDAPNLVSIINIGAFNVGNALGAWIGGEVLILGFRLTDIPIAAAVLAFLGFVVTLILAKITYFKKFQNKI